MKVSRFIHVVDCLLLPCLAVAIWLAVVAYPLAAVVPWMFNSTVREATPTPGFHAINDLMITSVGWAMAVALGAGAVGWLPGRVLGGALAGDDSSRRPRFVPLAALVLVPIVLPSYIVYYAWWQAWPIDTALHRWVIEHHGMQRAREATLYLGLVCWSWPLVSLCVAGASARRPRSRDDLLLIDGAPWGIRVLDRMRTDAPGLILGMLLAALATLHNTTCFDLAEVFTFANESRARAALGASPREVLQFNWPMLVIAGIGSIALWWRLGTRPEALPWQTSGISRGARVCTAVIWMMTVILPLALFWRGMAASGGVWQAMTDFFRLYRYNALSTLGLAAASAALATLVALGLMVIWHSDRKNWRFVGHVVSITWILASLLPGTILGLALQAAYSAGALTAVVYESPIILIIARLMSAGFVAVFIARWMARSEPRALRDLRLLDGAVSPLAVWKTARPALLGVAAATFAIVCVMSVGEVAVTAQVVPPMSIETTPISMTLLNDMHYQRPQSVLVAAVMMSGLGIIAALVMAVAWRSMSRGFGARRTAGVIALAAMLTVLSGCTPDDPDNLPPLEPAIIFGSPGQSLGQFGYPRCIDVDPKNHWVYVIDKTARVQRFDFNGQAQMEWHMPERENGKPTGVTVGPNGHVYVADTHYFRVMEYDVQGSLVNSFGAQGQGPGQFIYVTDIAFAPNGNIYVAEYGGHDRIQVFSPKGDYLFEFGSFGTEKGQYRRPQSLAFSHDGSELYIADACNHRIVVTDRSGQVLRMFGAAGRQAGELAYPYSIVVLPDQTLLVCEFGNNRIQRFSAAGESLGMYGRVGRGEGELQYPWAVAAADDRIFVLDSGNNRVQVIDVF
jgi:DNA-binding beta-propeller fold protein YncE